MATPTVPRSMAVNNTTDGTHTNDMASNRDVWSRWFNKDNPELNDGDDETVENIQKSYTICQKGYDIISAQCKIAGTSDSLFDTDSIKSKCGDFLTLNCTTAGLICKNIDQTQKDRTCPLSLRQRCQDYSIRFRCHYAGDNENNDSIFPEFDVRIYILLAVVPVVIFLARILWAYVFRRRRQQRRNQRRERRRLNRANGYDYDDDSSSASGLAHPPPSYHDLFGKTGIVGTGSSVFAISRNNIPICSKCESESCSVASIIGKQRRGQAIQENEQTEPGDALSTEQELQQSEPGSDAGIENIESEVTETGIHDSTASAMTLSQEETTSSDVTAQETDGFTEIDLTNTSPSQESTLEENASHDTNNFHIENENSDQNCLENNSSESLQVSASLATTSGPPDPALSLNPSLLKALNISQPCACACHRTIPLKHEGIAGCDNQGYAVEGDDVEANRHSSLPGMHVPVFGIHREYSNLSVTSVPQAELPSYDVALELMKKKQKEADSKES